MNIPELQSSLFILIDMQERLLPAMTESDACLQKCVLLTRAAAAMGLPGIVTEQYPKGLGPTVAPLKEVIPADWPVLPKSAFSCFGEPEFPKKVGGHQPKTLILAGIEAHVCVTQTAIDAANAGYQVFVIRDAVSSRKESDRDAAFDFLTAAGVRLVSAETILFFLLRDSRHFAFKAVSALVK